MACQTNADGRTLIISPDSMARLRRQGQRNGIIVGFAIVSAVTAMVVVAGLFADFPPLVLVALYSSFGSVLLIFWAVLLGVLWRHLATRD